MIGGQDTVGIPAWQVLFGAVAYAGATSGLFWLGAFLADLIGMPAR